MEEITTKKIENLEKKLDEFIKLFMSNNIDYKLINKDVKYIKEEITDIKKLITSEYVTKTEFDPIKKLVYGLVTTVLLSVVAAGLTLILK
jgi:hypothetical protein